MSTPIKEGEGAFKVADYRAALDAADLAHPSPAAIDAAVEWMTGWIGFPHDEPDALHAFVSTVYWHIAILPDEVANAVRLLGWAQCNPSIRDRKWLNIRTSELRGSAMKAAA